MIFATFPKWWALMMPIFGGFRAMIWSHIEQSRLTDGRIHYSTGMRLIRFLPGTAITHLF